MSTWNEWKDRHWKYWRFVAYPLLIIIILGFIVYSCILLPFSWLKDKCATVSIEKKLRIARLLFISAALSILIHISNRRYGLQKTILCRIRMAAPDYNGQHF